MRNRGHVFDHADLEPCGLQRADRGLTACAGSLYKDLDGLHAVFHSNLSCGFRGGLRRERSGLFLEPLKPSSPALAQETALPWVSVMVTIVLLKVD